MNIKPFVFAGSMIASAAAVAQEATQDFTDRVLSTRTRAEVLAELDADRARGRLDSRGETYGSFDPRGITSTRSRAEVLAELDAARSSGKFQHRGEAYGTFDTRAIASTRARSDVRAELLEAIGTGDPLSRGERR